MLLGISIDVLPVPILTSLLSNHSIDEIFMAGLIVASKLTSSSNPKQSVPGPSIETEKSFVSITCVVSVYRQPKASSVVAVKSKFEPGTGVIVNVLPVVVVVVPL